MKKQLRRVLSTFLALLLMLSTSLTAFANLGSSAGNTGGGESQGSGISGGGYAIGFGRCTEETYNGGSTEEELYTWIDTYAQKHYIPIEGKSYVIPHPGISYQNTPSKIHNNAVLGTSGDPAGILQAMASGNPGSCAALYSVGNGRWAIRPEMIEEVVTALRPANEALYAEWMSNRYGIGGHPVVIVVEMWAMSTKDAGIGYTAYDLANAAGADILNPNLSDTITTLSGSQSATAAAIAHSGASVTQSSSNIFYQIMGMLFGVSPKTGNLRTPSRWVNDLAKDADGGQAGSTITGCYPISIGGFGEELPSPGGVALFGVYEWDFDAPLLGKNARGHAEDDSETIAKGASVSGAFDFGFVNPKSSAWGTWKSWMDYYGGSTVDLEFKVYGVGCGNGSSNYTVNPSEIMSRGSSDANGIISGLVDTYTLTGYSFEQFVNDMKNGKPDGIPFDGMSGGYAPSNFNATTYQGSIDVIYYTELYVTPHGNGSGPQDGQKIKFACNQTHYAHYTPEGNNRTYKLFQTAIDGFSQLKDNGIGSAAFEAMAGTPTTEDMFISMGGSEYVVNMQYALHVEDYVRTYTVNADEFDNFMYYEAGDGREFNINQYQTSPYRLTTAKAWDKQTSNPTKNLAYAENVGAASPDQNDKFLTSANDFHDEVEKLFDLLDENVTQGSGYYKEEDYGVIVKANTLQLGGNWEIQNIDTAVVGQDAAMVSSTKQKLKRLSNYLKKLKVEVDKGDYNRGRDFARKWDNLNPLDITFMALDKTDKDYDSTANGKVEITFTYQCDSAYYKDSSKTYKKYWYCDGHGGHSEYKCGNCGAGHGAVEACPSQELSGYCQSVKTDNEKDPFKYSYSNGSCTENTDSVTGLGNGTYSHSGISCIHEHFHDREHTHYGHELATYRGSNKGTENKWDVPDYASSGEKFTPHTRNDEYWAATFGYGVTPNYEAGENYIAREADGDRGKTLSYNGTIEQVYKDVKYMDIVDCHVWRLAGGVADGLAGNTMVEETATQVITPIIEMACNNMGFTLYNTSPTDQELVFAQSYESPDGNTYQNVWTAVDEAFKEAIELDLSIDEEPESWKPNSELSAIGRLANSYNPGSGEENQFFADGKEGRKDVLTVEGEGDALTFTYNIEEQGGKSHWSFDGFLKQAIANTFYKEVSEDNAATAYRNYILVQSDYLSLGDKPLTLSGFSWASKSFDKGQGTTFDEESHQYGLTQAILNTNKDLEAADLSRYACESNAGWKPATAVDDKEGDNEDGDHADTALMDVKEGPGPRTLGGLESQPSMKTRPFGDYAEGPEEYDVQDYTDADNGSNMFVRLDKDPVYKTWTQQKVTQQTISSEAGINANFGTEGKGGSNGTNEDFNGAQFMPYVGYDNKYDSVEKDEHIYEPRYRTNTAYDPNATLVKGGYSGLTFDLYANPNYSSHLYEDTGAVGMSGIVSASGNNKNRIQNKGLFFPYYTGLNVIRWNPNEKYSGANTALVYDECISFFEAAPGVVSKQEKTVDAISRMFKNYKDNISQDLKQHGAFDDILAGGNGTIGSGTEMLITGVGYGGWSAGGGVTNEVVVFNPSAAEQTWIVPMSELLPDGQNRYLDDDTGYTERDQRITETIVSSTGNEDYISYVPSENLNLSLSSLKYRFELKVPSTYKGGITEAYTLEDYVSTQRDAETWTLEPGDEPMTVTTSGTYRLTLFDTQDKDTSVELNLKTGDQLSTDGTSIYLDRASDSAPGVSYDQLANSVAKFYINLDNLNNVAQSAMQATTIKNYIENAEKVMIDIDTQLNSCQGNWDTTQPPVDKQKVKDAIKVASDYLATVNTKFKGLKISWGGSEHAMYADGSILVPTSLKDELDVLLSEYGEMVSKIQELVLAFDLEGIEIPTIPTSKVHNWYSTASYTTNIVGQASGEWFGQCTTKKADGSVIATLNNTRVRVLPVGAIVKGTANSSVVEVVDAIPETVPTGVTYTTLTTPLPVTVTSTELNKFASDVAAIEVFNQSAYAAANSDYISAVQSWVYKETDDTDRQTKYQETMLELERVTASSGSTDLGKKTLFDNYKKYYNSLLDTLFSTFKVVDGKLQLSYSGGYDELEALLLKFNNLRTRFVTIATLNNTGDEFLEIPKLELVATDGRAATFKQNDRFAVDKGAMMTMNFNGLGMSKGSTLVVRIPFDKIYNDPAEVTIGMDGSMIDFASVANGTQNYEGYNHTLYKYRDGNDWVYVIEALEDARLGNMRFKFNQDANIMQFDGSCVAFDKVWLCDVGSAYSNPVYLGTTIEHQHYAAGNIYWNNATRTRSINKVIFDEVGMEATITVTKKSHVLYISKESERTDQLNQTAANNPHKVYNANWRFYVIGWETKGGSKILTADDPRLFIDSTVLKWPNKASGTVTVKTLREQACLVKFQGKVYLTLREEGYNHIILETGAKVTQYDWFTLDGDATQELKLGSSEAGTYPLEPNLPAKDLTTDNKSHWGYKYEFFFSTLDDPMDKPLFNTEWSTNLEYRFKSYDKETIVEGTENWEHDWIKHEEEVSNVTVVTPGRDKGSANYISLDDEFEVYFDNVGQFPGDGSANIGGTQSGLGYGWNANGIKLLGDRVELGIGDWYGADDDGVGEGEVEVDGATTVRETTETTGWIYAKYLIFNIDVYVFAGSDGKVDPALRAYNEDGSRNTPVLVEAGSPVYLGEYLNGGNNFADLEHSYQADWFNKGGFMDYAAPDRAAANNDDPFIYHFWCPLYNGEMEDSAIVEFHTININNSLASGNNGGNLNKVKDVAGVGKVLDTADTIGASGFTGPSPNNMQNETYSDAQHADNKVNTSVVGRLGALTIADTGDPRYSDSFKTTDLNDDSSESYLIYPIVRKVLQYSNIDTRDNPNIIGSQRGIVLDPFDVRGRIATEWLKDYVRTHNTSRDWSAYKLYADKAYNTYGSQWFKQSLVKFTRGMEDSNSTQFAQALPLTPSFNKHETFANKPLRVGYEIYCSVESIGDYYGLAGKDSSGEFDENEDADVSNLNNDYGQQKMQIRPFYAAVDATSDTHPHGWSGPVDVYMRSGDTYVLINSATDGSTEDHPITEVLQVMYNNYNPSYIETNTGNTPLDLDENMKRRMVTPDESRITYDVLNEYPDRKSILTKVSESTEGIGGEDLDIRYTYGCSQMLFLRERNLTYIGGTTAPLGWTNPVPTDAVTDNKQHAQKWYFGLGLPSSAVFVPHGEKLTDKTVLKTGIVVNSIDVVAIGRVWTLHYESEVSKMSFDYEGGSVGWEVWNPWHEKFPWLIPVTYYNIGDTSTADLDTQGSH